MKRRRNILILAALCSPFLSPAASAEESTSPKDRTAAEIEADKARAKEITEEARTKVGDWSPPERRQNKQETKQDEQPRAFYVSLGGEPNTHVGLGEVYRVRTAQLNATPLQLLEAQRGVNPTHEGGAITLSVGYELADWLDVELAHHDIEQMWQFGGVAKVHDPTLSGAAQDTESDQYSRLEINSYSLSLLPRWDVNEYFAVFGRIGVGYAETELYSHLTSRGWVSSTETCNEENGVRKCTTSYSYENRDWGQIHQRRNGLVYVGGIGVQITPVIRLEYMLRAHAPIGDASSDISSNLYFSFRIKSTWMNGCTGC